MINLKGKSEHFRLLLMTATSNENYLCFGARVFSALKAGSRLFSPVSFLLDVTL